MGGGSDTSRAVDVDADVVLTDQERLTCMNAHADTDLDSIRPALCSEAGLRLRSSGGRGSRVAKGDEEAIALRVDLASAVLLKCLAQDPTVIDENLGVPIA